MKTKTIIPLFTTIGLLATGLTACVSEPSQAELLSQAKISRADAEKTALAKVPNGTVKEAELEQEHGKLLWSLDLSTPGTANITEVNVNALTGEIVSTEIETAEAQAKEKAEDAKKEKQEKD
jgi:Peptidase propeptide and YPEB domain